MTPIDPMVRKAAPSETSAFVASPDNTIPLRWMAGLVLGVGNPSITFLIASGVRQPRQRGVPVVQGIAFPFLFPNGAYPIQLGYR
jgi:hypothetical protein